MDVAGVRKNGLGGLAASEVAEGKAFRDERAAAAASKVCRSTKGSCNIYPLMSAGDRGRPSSRISVIALLESFRSIGLLRGERREG